MNVVPHHLSGHGLSSFAWEAREMRALQKCLISTPESKADLGRKEKFPASNPNPVHFVFLYIISRCYVTHTLHLHGAISQKKKNSTAHKWRKLLFAHRKKKTARETTKLLCMWKILKFMTSPSPTVFLHSPIACAVPNFFLSFSESEHRACPKQLKKHPKAEENSILWMIFSRSSLRRVCEILSAHLTSVANSELDFINICRQKREKKRGTICKLRKLNQHLRSCLIESSAWIWENDVFWMSHRNEAIFFSS